MNPLHSSSPAPFTAEADWSKLHKDILQLTPKKLDSEFYQLCFRSVCSSWRSSSVPKNHLLNLPSKLTLPFDSNNNGNNNGTTFPLSKRAIFLITPPPNQQQTLNPWLIKMGPARTRLCHPL
ncbi:hypothetical protein TSUD_118550 [Trifolium subterraneum]|uniref:F-box domain-containing protein n=1 Tax=Trifolium subterraneum TaxID=3900 RepID=A0A2Z6M9L9_TRISU|nr:hypothetical protein TSUD_118550 [Trifolium subterraneum]